MPYAGDEHLSFFFIFFCFDYNVNWLFMGLDSCLLEQIRCVWYQRTSSLFRGQVLDQRVISQLCFKKVTELETQTNPKIGGSDEIKLMQLW